MKARVRWTTPVIGALLCAGAGLSAGCSDDDDAGVCRDVERAEGALFGASPDAGRGEVSGVVALLAQLTSERAELCSGVLIAPNLVLTARHCLPGGKSADALVGASIREPEDVRAVTEVFADEDRDLAVAVLEAGRPGRAGPVPLPLALDEEIRVGQRVKLAGFGRDERGDFGERLFVDEPIADFDRELVVVDGGGETGACTGDSGGPLLLARDGELRVLGILSAGSASCTEIDVYQRVAPVGQWIERIVEQTAAQRSADGC